MSNASDAAGAAQSAGASEFASATAADQESAFERWRRFSGAVGAGNLPGHVASNRRRARAEGRNMAAVLAAVAVLWVTEVMPLAATAIVGPTLCVLLGVADAKTALCPFADPIVFLFIGSFILAQAMMLHGLDKRVALAFLQVPWIGGHPLRVLAGLGAVTAIVSMWISNTATAAMMLPVGLGLLQVLQQARQAGQSAPRSAIGLLPQA